MNFVRNHLLDLTVVLLPPARPLRLLRAVVLILEAFDRYGQSVTRPRSRLSVFVGGTTVLLLFLSSLAVLDAERGAPGSQVQNFGDAAWWSVVSVTTVGYGDISPVTTEGRIVALVLMFGGIGLIGFITGSLGSWMVEHFGSGANAKQREVDNRELLVEVRALRAEVAALRSGEASSVAQGGESGNGP